MTPKDKEVIITCLTKEINSLDYIICNRKTEEKPTGGLENHLSQLKSTLSHFLKENP